MDRLNGENMEYTEISVDETDLYDIVWPCGHPESLYRVALIAGASYTAPCATCSAAPEYRKCPAPKTVSKILGEAANTFAERNEDYKDGYIKTGAVLEAIFKGVDHQPKTATEWAVFHLYIFEVAKLVRFANSKLTHVDSQHDNIVYSAMIEEILGGME